MHFHSGLEDLCSNVAAPSLDLDGLMHMTLIEVFGGMSWNFCTYELLRPVAGATVADRTRLLP